MRNPEIDGVTEQHGFALVAGAEPARYRLRGRVFAIDAVNDPIELEGRKRPVDRGPRGLNRIAVAAKLLCDAPADLEAGPDRRIERTDAADEFAARLFLDHERAKTVQ